MGKWGTKAKIRAAESMDSPDRSFSLKFPSGLKGTKLKVGMVIDLSQNNEQWHIFSMPSKQNKLDVRKTQCQLSLVNETKLSN